MTEDELSAEFYALSEEDRAHVIEWLVGHAPAAFRRRLNAITSIRRGEMPAGVRLVVVDLDDDEDLEPDDIPEDFPVRPMRVGETGKDPMTCGVCHLTWDDAVPTQYTPTPSARCPFEAFHRHGD